MTKTPANDFLADVDAEAASVVRSRCSLCEWLRDFPQADQVTEAFRLGKPRTAIFRALRSAGWPRTINPVEQHWSGRHWERDET